LPWHKDTITGRRDPWRALPVAAPKHVLHRKLGLLDLDSAVGYKCHSRVRHRLASPRTAGKKAMGRRSMSLLLYGKSGSYWCSGGFADGYQWRIACLASGDGWTTESWWICRRCLIGLASPPHVMDCPCCYFIHGMDFSPALSSPLYHVAPVAIGFGALCRNATSLRRERRRASSAQSHAFNVKGRSPYVVDRLLDGGD
jgi:hypothetical protein